MDQQQAYRLVSETFTQAFNKDRFFNFIQNLLNQFDTTSAVSWTSGQIKNAFKSHILEYERIGTYVSNQDEHLDILVVYLTDEYKLDRARTAIRNFTADHLTTREEKNAALVAFVPPSHASWRFSFIKMEYATVERDTGFVSVETRLTPARRFSYIVGEEESCHTAQTRFLDLLRTTDSNPTLAEIEEAFSVESVTKEFFTNYTHLFEEIYAALEELKNADSNIATEFSSKKISTIDFAKKLMGQIVFLYFLQRKGWLGVSRGQEWGSGPRDFLRRLVQGEFGTFKNFYNDALEPLFFDSLATERGKEAWWEKFSCRIPFLNGGLFEPLGNYDWKNTEIILPNTLFTNSEIVEEGIVGTGVLDVFDRYNFTVIESEPLEKEVAIDPEMLGQVFENLIEENRRRGLGAYYTPREIVHYMCRISLVNYLDMAINTGKQSLYSITLEQHLLFDDLSPKQASLQTEEYEELIPREDLETFILLGEELSHYDLADPSSNIRMPNSIETNAQLLDTKLAEITICDPAVGSGAFPVGMMTEIVRSRTALTTYLEDANDRTSYYLKRHTIQNCLYGVDIDDGAIEIAKLRLWLSLVVEEDGIEKINPLPNLDYKMIPGNSLLGFPFQSPRIKDVTDLKARYFEETDPDKKDNLREEIEEKLTGALKASKKSLGYEVNFDFDIYFSEVFRNGSGFDVVIANPPYIDSESMTKQDKELRKIVKSTYLMTKGNWDIYIAFFERGFKLLGNQGVLSFITPDKWISKPFGDELRTRTINQIRSVLRAGRDVFESVKVDAIVSVFTVFRQPEIEILDFNNDQTELIRVVDKKLLEAPYAFDWLFSKHVDLLTKIETQPGRLSALGKCENACATSDAYKLKEFIQEEQSVDSKTDNFRIINTGTIGKYLSKWGIREMVYLGNKYLEPVVKKQTFLEKFPKSYGVKSTKKKIIMKGLNLLDACLDIDGTTIPGKTTLIIPSEDLDVLKLLLAIVNSSLALFYIRQKYPASSYNQGITFTRTMLDNLPIPDFKSKDRREIISLVDSILITKTQDPGADTKKLEQQIDHYLYGLFGLSTDEITALENEIK